MSSVQRIFTTKQSVEVIVAWSWLTMTQQSHRNDNGPGICPEPNSHFLEASGNDCVPV